MREELPTEADFQQHLSFYIKLFGASRVKKLKKKKKKIKKKEEKRKENYHHWYIKITLISIFF